MFKKQKPMATYLWPEVDHEKLPPMPKCKPPKKDTVNHPDHYNSIEAQCTACGCPIECIDVARNLRFNLGNAIKYIWRCDHKNSDIQDLKKAIWYLEDEIKRRENENAKPT